MNIVVDDIDSILSFTLSHTKYTKYLPIFIFMKYMNKPRENINNTIKYFYNLTSIFGKLIKLYLDIIII